ncbi:MAG: hypothetical protein AB1798_02640 [Spirochaetota bacterium]
MKKISSKCIWIFLLLIFSCSPLFSQGTEGIQTPEEYSPDEFPTWLKDLRRAEIILIGSVPVTLLFSSVFYQLFRYAKNGFTQEYAPSLFAGPVAVPLSEPEKRGVLIAGISISGFIALMDFIIGKVNASKHGKTDKKSQDKN